MVRSSINPDQYSLAISNAVFPTLNLEELLIIVAIGLPLVLALLY